MTRFLVALLIKKNDSGETVSDIMQLFDCWGDYFDPNGNVKEEQLLHSAARLYNERLRKKGKLTGKIIKMKILDYTTLKV